MIAFAVRHPLVRRFLNAIRIRELASAGLRLRPLVRTVPGSRLRYRIASLDNLLVAREVIGHEEYGALRQFGPIESFADLGCNCGYFTVFAASLGAPAEIRGLAIDAHPGMIAAAQRHVTDNGLANVHATWGLLGAPDDDAKAARFYVNIDSAGSSQFDRAPASNVTKNPWREIEAPVVSLTSEWERHFGDAGCDVLKIDIEGSEELLLHREQAFLRRAGLIVVEVHKWLVDAARLEAFLDDHGFSRLQTLRSDDSIEVVIYLNRQGRFSGMLHAGTN